MKETLQSGPAWKRMGSDAAIVGFPPGGDRQATTGPCQGVSPRASSENQSAPPAATKDPA